MIADPKPARRVNEVTAFLRTHGACDEAREWAKAGKYKTMAEAWDACPNPQWMLWACERIGHSDDRGYRLFACWSVRQVWHLLTDERSRTAVEVAERFAEGQATREELAAAGAAAGAAAWAAAGAAAGDAQADALRRYLGNPFSPDRKVAR